MSAYATKFADLDLDSITEILRHLHVADMASLLRCSKSLCTIIDESDVWRFKYLSMFRMTDEEMEKVESWKNLYRESTYLSWNPERMYRQSLSLEKHNRVCVRSVSGSHNCVLMKKPVPLKGTSRYLLEGRAAAGEYEVTSANWVGIGFTNNLHALSGAGFSTENQGCGWYTVGSSIYREGSCIATATPVTVIKPVMRMWLQVDRSTGVVSVWEEDNMDGHYDFVYEPYKTAEIFVIGLLIMKCELEIVGYRHFAEGAVDFVPNLDRPTR